MAFDALEVALSVIPLLTCPLEKIARRDPDLARQIRRATHSVPQNIAEGRERKGGDRVYLYTVAFGSTAEVVTSLRIARPRDALAPDALNGGGPGRGRGAGRGGGGRGAGRGGGARRYVAPARRRRRRDALLVTTVSVMPGHSRTRCVAIPRTWPWRAKC
jgi:four helix bundle protein